MKPSFLKYEDKASVLTSSQDVSVDRKLSSMTMRQSTIKFNPQLVYLTLTCLMCVLLPFSTARIQSEAPTYEEFNKRDVETTTGLGTGGVRLLCQAHPRNCPGGYVLKRNRMIDSIFNREPIVPVTREERRRAEAILQAGEELKRNLRSLRNGLRSKLFEMLRPSLEGSSEESKEV